MKPTKERSIILNTAPMVRAVLDGTKTQHLVIVKPQPKRDESDVLMWALSKHRGYGVHGVDVPQKIIDHCPFGVVGNRVWVREAAEKYLLPNILTGEPTNAEGGRYIADGEPVLDPSGFELAWWYPRARCPANHMPRWASRITLELTDVRIERMNTIRGTESGDANTFVWALSFQRVT